MFELKLGGIIRICDLSNTTCVSLDVAECFASIDRLNVVKDESYTTRSSSIVGHQVALQFRASDQGKSKTIRSSSKAEVIGD